MGPLKRLLGWQKVFRYSKFIAPLKSQNSLRMQKAYEMLWLSIHAGNVTILVYNDDSF